MWPGLKGDHSPGNRFRPARICGSVLLATLFHGAINIFQGLFLAGVDPASRYWWLVLSYGTAALALAAVLGRWYSRHRSSARIAEAA